MLVVVTITNRQFDSDVYSTLSGAPVRLHVYATGGPYTLEIDDLVPSHQVAADAETEIGFTAPDPGRFQMRLLDTTGAVLDTAALNIRETGER